MTSAFARKEMMRIQRNFPMALLLLAGVALMAPRSAAAGTQTTAGASWLLERSRLDRAGLVSFGGGPADRAPRDRRFFQDEFSAREETFDTGGSKRDGGGPSPVVTMLASLVLPGSGEAIMGYGRGYFMMAADILAWSQVIKNDKDGEDIRTDYLAYADAHYTDQRLVEGYNPGSSDVERSGEGRIYFPAVPDINDVSELHNLPLYVTKEEDSREYYENLGKWDQFIFGWDDYQRASVDRPEYDYEPTYQRSDLQQPWVSRNRTTYREMRDASNDAFKKRDRWLYVNIGLRIFSVLQVAWLEGLLSGEGDDAVSVAGHRVNVVAAPRGPYSGSVGAKVFF